MCEIFGGLADDSMSSGMENELKMTKLRGRKIKRETVAMVLQVLNEQERQQY
jgi:hypothetical protein